MKAFWAAVLGLVMSITFLWSTPAHAANLSQGKQLFASNCAACHMGGRNVVMATKTLKQDALEKYLADYGADHNVDAIVYQIKNGKNAMPAFRGRLTDTQIADVAAYVNSQAENGWKY